LADSKLAVPVSAARAEELTRILRSAVARACPRELDSEREDLVQSALLRIMERTGTGEDNQIRSTSYLVKVAFSTIVDVMRRLHRRRAAGVEETEGPRSVRALEVDSVLVRPEIPRALRECLGRLTRSRRSAVMLYLQGFTAREAARALQLDEKAVKNLVFRGIHDLRSCLTGKGVTP
jgi:RNA polymerase sigma-70 factor (ECF subfamily)